MAVPTFAEFQEGKTISSTTKGKTTVPSFAEFNKSQPKAEPSTLGKVAGFLAPTITKTVEKYKRGQDVTARDIGGSALEAASYLIPGGAIAKGVGLGVKAGTLASKLAVPASIGAVSGSTFGAGQAVAEGGDVSGVAKEALKTGAIGGVLGGAIGAAGAGWAARKLAQKTPTEYYQEALQRANFGTIPEAGKPTIPGQIVPEAVPPVVAPEAQPVGFRPKTVAEVPEVLPVSPTVAPKGVEPTTPKIPQSPEYIKSVETRAQKMASKDPEFIPSTDADKIVKFDEVAKVTPKEQLIKWSTGAEKNTPEGLPATTIRGLVEEDMLANPSKYTPDEIFRVSTSAVNSEAGALLQGVKVKRGGIIDNSMDFIRQEQSKLQEKIRAERLITKEAIKRFVNELPVCTI